MESKLTIYLAGPLFTEAERIWNKRLGEELVALIPNAEIVLPQVQAMKYMKGASVDFQGLVEDCIRGLERAHVIVAVLDGSDADSGTCWECGYAYAKRKRIIGVRTDFRGSEDEGLNAMLRRTCSKVIYHPSTREDPASLAREIAAHISDSEPG
jgi:nucleoside 2-deoxyribosyltransferase